MSQLTEFFFVQKQSIDAQKGSTVMPHCDGITKKPFMHHLIVFEAKKRIKMHLPVSNPAQ